MIELAYAPEEARGIWVFLEHRQDELEGVALELLGKARELADTRGVELVGLLLGDGVEALAAEALRTGADRVLLVEHPLLKEYSTEGYTSATEQAVRSGKPESLLLGATPNGRDLAGRLAVRVRTGLTADCTDLAIQEGTGLLLGEVAGFGGGVVANIACPRQRPQMATVRPGVFPPPARREVASGKVERFTVELRAEQIRTRLLERVVHPGTDLTRAKSLVVAGSGTGGNLGPLEELAHLLGAEVGATRVAIDRGWIERERQIGQTGYVCRPKLAIACGVSGATQFMVGIDAAERVVAINTDPEAPIFEQADYCIVDDVFRVLPPLLERLRQAAAGAEGAAR